MSDLVRGIHHINIHCTDKNQLERTVLFYKEQFDFEPIRHWKNGQKEVYLLSTGNTALEIAAQSTEPEEKSKGTITHIALDVRNIEKLAEKLKDSGVKFTKEVTDNVIKAEKPIPIKVAFIEGPAGEEIELFEEYE